MYTTTTAPQAAQDIQTQDANRKSRILPSRRLLTSPHSGSLPPSSRTRNERHLPTIHNKYEDDNTSSNPLLFTIKKLEALSTILHRI